MKVDERKYVGIIVIYMNKEIVTSAGLNTKVVTVTKNK